MLTLLSVRHSQTLFIDIIYGTGLHNVLAQRRERSLECVGGVLLARGSERGVCINPQ